ncbi:MAG: 1,4-alpha-glucan branching protein GlgB [Gammaproteobacteria bacterium]|nr:1,4-alpha-glucan branching protein GlgB [Gammaproteobacteria bacterium]
MNTASIKPDLIKVVEARHHDPFSVLGKHRCGNEEVIRVHIRGAVSVSIVEIGEDMKRIPDSNLYEWRGPTGKVPERYRVCWTDGRGRKHTRYDPYCFPAQISESDLQSFQSGTHYQAHRFLGARCWNTDDVPGVLFATWAPNAERVSVVGDFNQWDGTRHPMRNRGASGVWELLIPDLQPGALYKYEILGHDGKLTLKSDPYGFLFEKRPSTAAVVTGPVDFRWTDEDWMAQRRDSEWLHKPLSIYEVHLGSWQRTENGDMLSYRELAHQLVDYVGPLGFTHIELLPVTEHPLDASWGYQTTGYFAPTSRFGEPDDFRYFVNHCHIHDIGVLIDWAPAHFPKDPHGIARYDGTALYEHEDPRRGEHRDWGTLVFNYGRHEVKSFLLSSAMYWLDEFHIDGMRVDAVASMLYLDYSREAGDWIPNVHGGNENLEAIDLMRELNRLTHQDFPGSLMIAEESTAWPLVTRPTWVGGLGFSMKWNMGWMHDSLQYMEMNPIYRHYNHDKLTFGLLYAFHENFVLPFSHDEVVHGKRSMLSKMPGDEWQRFANLRLLYTYMFTYPGKKLLFMGNEFAQLTEWDHDSALDWHLLDAPVHHGVQALIADLNRLFRENPALYQYDFESKGFEWIDCHDASQSVLSYLRRSDDAFLLMILNFTPVPRHQYRIGVPAAGVYKELLNSDSSHYGGGNVGNAAFVRTTPAPWMGRRHSLTLTLPPLAGIILQLSEPS